jgi:DNA polymerase III subunit delta'
MKPLWHPQTAAAVSQISTQSTSYLFSGPQQIGKRTTAVWLARQLNCTCSDNRQCQSCTLIQAGSFPDLITVTPDETAIGVSQVHLLNHDLRLNPYSRDGVRMVIFDPAESLTIEAQNSLLKILEEPPSRTIFILLTTQPDAILPTVRSRCQTVYFATVPAAALGAYLTNEVRVDHTEAIRLADIAEGHVGLAVQLAADQAARQSFQQAEQSADQVLSASIFERLLLAAKLAASTELVSQLTIALGRKLRHQLRASQDPSTLSQIANQLQALERYHRFSARKVNPKAALEGLMLDL